MRKSLGRTWRACEEFLHWSVHELPQSPGLEIYGSIADRQNRAFHARLDTGGTSGFQDYISPYQFRNITKTVWIFWEQGELNAPYIVQLCIDSWRVKNPGWNVFILDHDSVSRYSDVSDIFNGLPKRFTANLLRLRLLSRYGGVWADATTLCHRPLDDWIPLLGGQTGFFAFRGPSIDRWIDNWFIAANCDSRLIQAWERTYERYVTRLRRMPKKYFMMIYSLQYEIWKDRALRREFQSSGGLPAVPAFFLQGYLEGKCDAGPFKRALEAGFPVSKLNWRTALPDDALMERFAACGLIDDGAGWQHHHF